MVCMASANMFSCVSVEEPTVSALGYVFFFSRTPLSVIIRA